MPGAGIITNAGIFQGRVLYEEIWYAQTRWELLHLRFVSRIDRARIDGWLARILILYQERKQFSHLKDKLDV